MVFIRAWHFECSDEVQEQELSAGHLTIGRGLDNDILLDVAGASRHHARVELDGHEVWVVDLGSTNGTWVAGERVERKRLHSGDRFQIGAMVFEVASSSLTRPTIVENWAKVQVAKGLRPAGVRPRRERAGAPQAVVTVVEPTDRRPTPADREVPPRGLALGRDPTNDICLEDVEVSRFHARIELRGARYLLQDLGSRNGTWVERIRVRQHMLSSGDTFTVGPFTLRFVTVADSAEEPTRPEQPTRPELAISHDGNVSSPAVEPPPPTAAVPTLMEQRLSARCAVCGAELEPTAAACAACGQPVTPGPT